MQHLFKTISFSFLLLFGVFCFAQKAEHLPPEVNSEYEEREPTLSPDGKTLYFWRRNMPANMNGLKDAGDIWISQQDEAGKWTRAVHPVAPINTAGQDFVWYVSPNDDTLWTNRILLQPGKKDAGIGYHTKDGNGDWQAQRYMTIKGYEAQGQYKDYFMSGQRVLVIPNVADDSYGGTDLYVCFPLNDTTWSEPTNLGDIINTPGDEDAPYISPDGKYLFFDSNGHGGRGNHDIFFSQRLDDSWTNWSVPRNVGAPINTMGYDFDFQMTHDGKFAYWCSESNTYGSNDIFRLDLRNCDISIFPEGNMVRCKGDTILLEAGFTMGKNLWYQWYKDEQLLKGENERWLKVTESGIYKLSRKKDGCDEMSKPKAVFFQDIPTAAILSGSGWICPNDSVQLQAKTCYECNYQWTKNDVQIAGANRASFAAKSPGTYRIKVTNKTCASYSEPIKLEDLQSPQIVAPDLVKEEKKEADSPEWQAVVMPAFEPKEIIIRSLKKDGNHNYLLVGLQKNDKIFSFYSKEGTLIWTKKEPISDPNKPFYSDIDGDGNVIISSNDKYLLKVNASGKVLWQKETAIPNVLGVTYDASGNIFTMGKFADTLQLEGETLYPSGRGSVYLAKHDPNGKLKWMRIIATDGLKDDFGNRLGTDCSGNVYIIGKFEKIANFGAPILRAAANVDNFFLAKFNAEGKQEWAKKITTPPMYGGTGDMKIDCHGNMYFVLNNRIFKYNKFGNPVWEEGVFSPTPVVKKLRISQVNGEYLYLCGITRDPDNYFLSRYTIGAKDPFQMLWFGNNANKDDRQEPSILTDEQGDVYFAGSVKGKSLYEESPSPNRAPTVLIARYGMKKDDKELPPINICAGDSIRLTIAEKAGLTYKWMLNGETIKGERKSTFFAKKEGEYKVMISTPNCTKLTAAQRIIFRCEDEKKNNAVATTKTEKPAPKPEKVTPPPPPKEKVVEKVPPAPPVKPKDPKVETDIEYSDSGKPKRIKNRRVQSAETIVLKSTKVKIAVWDHAAADNDTISLNVNGVWVIQKYRLEKSKKVVEVELKSGENNFIVLYAHSLGNIPPCTVSLSIHDGTREQVKKLESNLSNCGALNLQIE
jgi:hypothetical protein